MTVTTAILEFLVIGSRWVATIAAVLVIVPLAAGSQLPLDKLPDMPDMDFLLAVITVPITYLFGVISQAVTWRHWYLPKVHLPSLAEELVGEQEASYQAVYRELRKREFPLGTVKFEKEVLESPKDLARMLDFLRWELMRWSHEEPAKQYLVQFHLYRLVYGSIPAAVGFALVLVLGTAVALVEADPAHALLFAIGAAISAVLARLAYLAAAHRRRRLWKYLMLSFNSMIEEEARSAR